MSTMSTPAAPHDPRDEEDVVSASRPESVDLFGVHHRYGCPARVTSRPASIAGRTLHRCLDCKAATITFEASVEDDDEESQP